MTLKRAYINLTLSILIISVNLLLYAFDVSRLAIIWTHVIFWITALVAIVIAIYTVYDLKKNQDLIKEEDVLDEEKSETFIEKHKYAFLDWIAFVTTSLMIILVLFMYIVLPTNVEGSSMKSTLLDGERILMYHFNYEPKRNDVVIVHITDKYLDTRGSQVNLSAEYDNQDQVYFVKRVVAIPGDVITFEEIGNTNSYNILINGDIYQNQYYQIYTVNDEGRVKMLSYLDSDDKLKVDQYLAFGDNESFSYDSRNIGVIYKEDMIGKAIYKLLPFGGISHG